VMVLVSSHQRLISWGDGKLTERVATRKLRFLRVFALQLIANAIEKLHVALLRVLLQSVDEGPRHGASSLAADGCVGTIPS